MARLHAGFACRPVYPADTPTTSCTRRVGADDDERPVEWSRTWGAIAEWFTVVQSGQWSHAVAGPQDDRVPTTIQRVLASAAPECLDELAAFVARWIDEYATEPRLRQAVLFFGVETAGADERVGPGATGRRASK